MARQRAAYGSISPTKDGITRVRYYGDLHDGKGYRRLSKNIRGNRREAQMFLANMQAAHNEDKPTMTVEDVYKQWYLPEIRERLSPSTLNNYAVLWRAYIKPRWALLPVADVRPLDVQNWLSELTSAQAKQCMAILQPLFDYPVRYEVIDTNVMRVGYVMPKRVNAHDGDIYKLDELELMAQSMQGATLEPAFLLSAFGSCRTGEALGVEVRHVSFETAANGMTCAVVEIEQQIDIHGKLATRTKTKDSKRFVVLPEPYSLRLREICAEKKDGLLTCDNYGMPFDRAKVSRLWRKTCTIACCSCHPFKNLRASWRTFMEWELKGEPDKLEKLMGHKGTSVTARHYDKPEQQVFCDYVAELFSDRTLNND